MLKKQRSDSSNSQIERFELYYVRDGFEGQQTVAISLLKYISVKLWHSIADMYKLIDNWFDSVTNYQIGGLI